MTWVGATSSGGDPGADPPTGWGLRLMDRMKHNFDRFSSQQARIEAQGAATAAPHSHKPKGEAMKTQKHTAARTKALEMRVAQLESVSIATSRFIGRTVVAPWIRSLPPTERLAALAELEALEVETPTEGSR